MGQMATTKPILVYYQVLLPYASNHHRKQGGTPFRIAKQGRWHKTVNCGLCTSANITRELWKTSRKIHAIFTFFHGGIGVVHLLFSLQRLRSPQFLPPFSRFFHAIFTAVFVLFQALFHARQNEVVQQQKGWFALKTRWLGTTSKNEVEEA